MFVLFTLIYLTAELIITGNQFGVPLDDTWIHFRFAENFAHGHFFEYNIGEPTPGTTSPLWVVILSVPFLFSRSLIIPYSLLIGSLFFLFACFEVYKISLKLNFNPNYALLITLLTVMNGRLLWSSLSGMEITLFVWLTLLTARIHLSEIESNKINLYTGIILGFAALTRPETYLFGLLYYFATIILLRKSLKQNLLPLLLSFILFVIILSPYPLFSYSLTGKFVPNTFQGQQGAFRYLPDINFIDATWRLFFKDNFIVFILWIISTGYFIRSVFKKNIEQKFLLVNLWVTLFPVISAFLTPNWRHHGRYLIPLIPFINLASINILIKFIEHYRQRKPQLLKYRRKLIALTILLTIAGAGIFAEMIGKNTDNINDQQVTIAKWINQNLPNEQVIALNDIGAITFLTNKRIIDMEGLVTPEILKIRRMNLEDQDPNVMALLKKNNVNYLIIYPQWYEILMNKYSNGFTQVFSAKLDENTICGGIEMFVYKINWDRININ